MADQYKVVHDLSNGAIFTDIEQPLPSVSRSRYYLTLNISERYEIQTYFQWNTNRDFALLNSVISNDLE